MPRTDGYRLAASMYDTFVDPLISGLRDTALEVLPPETGWRVLDVGCGTGIGLSRYVSAGCIVTGVDVSPAMIAKAEERLGAQAELHLTDGAVLPFDDHSFDLVTTTLVLHEVPAADRGRFIEEMLRVTRPKGDVLVVDYRFGSLRGWKGPVFKVLTTAIEGVSGHFSGYRSFRSQGGLPGVLAEVGARVTVEKPVAGGNLAVYLID